MTPIEPVDGGFLIEKKMLYGANFPDGKYINLNTETGEDMRYIKHEHHLIDYPGEYNIENINFKVFEGKNKKLNYLIKIKNKKIGLIQSPEVLEHNNITDQDVWLYQNENVAEKLDQLELEGEKIKLETLEE